MNVGQASHYVENKFPGLFRFLQGLYRKTGHYKKKETSRRLQQAETETRTVQLLEVVFKGDNTVRYGPFKGMKYIHRSNGSALLPKILGSYEEPIHEWVNSVIVQKKYVKILDIGAAEGYYAVGFALKFPDAVVLAYDTNPNANTLLQELAVLNGVTNISSKSICDFGELKKECGRGTFIFCDIEGAEAGLLDPVTVPEILYTDLLVEVHDCFRPGITDQLIARFLDTHKISLIVDYPTRYGNYSLPEVPNTALQEAMNERRPRNMRWLLMERIDVHN